MVLQGKSVAPGIAVGRIHIYKNNIILPVENFIPAGTERLELDHYFSVKNQALKEIEKIRLSLQELDSQKAEIFRSHQEIVDDVIINEEIPLKITNEHWSGDWAIYQVYETVLTVLRKSKDSFIAERAADFDDVRSLLLRLWYGLENEKLANLKEPAVIAVHELLPSDTASIDKNKVLAIITETGGETSHAAIIAKSYGIPTVLSIKDLLNTVKHGQMAAVNADEGIVILDPEEAVVREYVKKSVAFLKSRTEDESFLSREGRTACGEKIDIGLNIANIDTDLSAEKYADSAGLFRTEFLYMGRSTLPDEEEQFCAYRRVLECFGSRAVILRTLDIGGDKQLSALKLPREENPFLGNRALRFCFSNPEIFKTQIKAALRASVYGNLWLMFPMAASVDDIRKAKEHVAFAKEQLQKEGKTYTDVKTGIMIEIPSIALIADIAAKEVDFASIGSNDLCQYLCAADRMNSNVGNYYQSFHPAIFRLIKEISVSFKNSDKPVSICGELGSNPLAVPVLIGLGLRKFSMGAASAGTVKRIISSVTVKNCEQIAVKVLEMATAQEVMEFLKKHNESCNTQ